MKLSINALMLPIAGFVLLAGANAAVALEADISVSKEAVLEAYHLRDCTMGTVQIQAESHGKYSAEINVDETPYTLEVWPFSIRSENYRLLVQNEKGELVDTDPSPITTYRGFFRGHGDSSKVAISIRDNGVRGVFLLNNEWFTIEPVGKRAPDNSFPPHIVYREADIIHNEDHKCGTTEKYKVFKDDHLLTYDVESAGKGLRDVYTLCQLAIDSDYEFYADNGSSVSATEADIENLVNSISAQYENDLQLTYEITTTVVRTSVASDPYTNIPDSETLLYTFRNLWNSSYSSVTRDTAHLLTGQYINDGVLGLAFVGVVCSSSNAYGLSWSTHTGVFAERVNVTAHELGHNWNAGHCDEVGDNNYQAGCCSSRYTMCSHSVSNPIGEFCTASINVIDSYRDFVGCLGTVVDAIDLPFDDTFPSTTINTTNWRYVDGPYITNGASNEPSSPYSLRIDNTEEIRSNHIRMAVNNYAGGTFSYYYQQTGTESGEGLYLEYYNSSLNWVELDYIDAGSNMSTFAYRELSLPEDAIHNLFRFRFRTVGNANNDTWYVDDVYIEGCLGEEILEHPASDSDCVNGAVTFTVSASGSPSYQWLKGGMELSDGGNISGATTASLTISSIDASDVASYRCRVTNACGPVLSNAASLSIDPGPSVVTHPQSVELCLGELTTLSSVFDGPEPITYRWEKDGEIIDGETNYYLTIPAVEMSDSGEYRCEGSNACEAVWTNVATITVLEAPTIAGQPEDTCAEFGETASFTVDVDGTPPYFFLWHHNGESIPNSNSQTLTIENVEAADAGEYYAIFVEYAAPDCEVTTETATLEVGNCPGIPVCEHAVWGDLDDDGDIDLADFGIFQDCFGPEMALIEGCQCANLDSSNYDIDLLDYLLFESVLAGP